MASRRWRSGLTEVLSPRCVVQIDSHAYSEDFTAPSSQFSGDWVDVAWRRTRPPLSQSDGLSISPLNGALWARTR